MEFGGAIGTPTNAPVKRPKTPRVRPLTRQNSSQMKGFCPVVGRDARAPTARAATFGPMTANRLGCDVVGDGPRRVIVLNDRLCDTSTWGGARAYLDLERFTWAFTDLRGYGRVGR